MLALSLISTEFGKGQGCILSNTPLMKSWNSLPKKEWSKTSKCKIPSSDNAGKIEYLKQNVRRSMIFRKNLTLCHRQKNPTIVCNFFEEPKHKNAGAKFSWNGFHQQIQAGPGGNAPLSASWRWHDHLHYIQQQAMLPGIISISLHTKWGQAHLFPCESSSTQSSWNSYNWGLDLTKFPQLILQFLK